MNSYCSTVDALLNTVWRPGFAGG